MQLLSSQPGLVTVKDTATQLVHTIGLRDKIGRWTLMASFDLEGVGPVAVFENLDAKHGPMRYIGQNGIVLELSKSLEPTQVPEEACYRGHSKETALRSGVDILGREILALGRDPGVEDVAPCIPPIRRVKYSGYEAMHTFVGSPDCADVIPISYDGSRCISRINPCVVAPEIGRAIEAESIWEGLVGGWLPVVRFVYPVSEGVTWDTLTFADVNPPSSLIQPGWYRYLKLENGRILEAHYYDSYLPYPFKEEPDPSAFYINLYKLHHYWENALAGAMRIEVPEQWIDQFSRHAFVLEMITRIGDHPRYGVSERNYGAPEHDGFQDILNSAVNGYLEWGLPHRAKGYFENYFTYFVRPDGALNYRGPEIGQYARMLTNLAQYYEFTGDAEFLLRHQSRIEAILNILMTRRERAKTLDRGDPAYGMVPGRHEADISFVTATAATLDYEQPYFSNSTETWRAFNDLGRVWTAIGRDHKNVELIEKGQALMNEASEIKEDIYRSIERSILTDRDMPYLPLIAGSKEYHLDAPYRSRPESFDENRVWSEMMHSGMIKKETVDLIMAYTAAHNGLQMGIFTNRYHVVAFQCYGEAYGLLQHDMIHEFLLFFYAHALHLHTRGTWSAFECVDLDRDEARYAQYCAPAQMTIPTITKWMLVFEEPQSETLWLAKAVPRSWLASGEHIKVENAPTRWGKLSYLIQSELERGEIYAVVTLPARMAAEAKVRFRAPEAWRLSKAIVNGQEWSDFNPVEETVRLPQGIGGTIEIRAFFQQQSG